MTKKQPAPTMKLDKETLDGLDPEVRAQVERALKPLNSRFTLLFNHRDVASWRRAAESSSPPREFADWIRRALNDAVGVKHEHRLSEEERMRRKRRRDATLSRRANTEDLKKWSNTASLCGETLTEWVELTLSKAAEK